MLFARRRRDALRGAIGHHAIALLIVDQICDHDLVEQAGGSGVLRNDAGNIVLLSGTQELGAARGHLIDDLRGLLAGASPVEVRLDAMMHDGMISRDGEGYRLAAKGRAWATVLSAWRRLLGMSPGG